MSFPWLLLPGLDGSGALHEPLREALPAAQRLIVLRYPPAVALGYDALLERVRESVPEGEFGLIGESFSGPLAIRLAAERPAGLRGLALVASFVKAPWPSWLAYALRLTGALPFLLPAPRLALRALLLSGAVEARVEELKRALGGVRAAVLAGRLREIFRVDVSAELQRVSGPILYLGASRDRLIGRRGAAQLSREMPRASQVWIDAPHLILQARPEESAAALLAFFHKTPTPASPGGAAGVV